MNLPEVENRVLDILGAAIADCLGWDQDQADQLRVLRYHGGRTATPPLCCTEIGSLVVSWEVVNRQTTLGARGRNDPGKPGWPAADLTVWYQTCWPANEPTDDGVVLRDDEQDAASARLGLIAHCGAVALECSKAELDMACGGFSFEGVDPTGPSVDCAGVRFRCTVALTTGAAPTEAS